MSLSQRIRPNSEAAPWVIAEVKSLEADLATLKETFNLMYSANHRAIKAWQAAHPEHRDMVWPDQAALVGWLLDERDSLITLQANVCADWAEDHTHLENLCHKAGVSKAQIEGDSYGVPGIMELADMLGAEIARLRAALESLSRRAPIMGSTGDYRDGQLYALEAVAEVAERALEAR